VIATLIVAVAPRFGERQRATRGAGQLQSWLNLAKQRAVRDQRPGGIRIPSSATQYIDELLYVEQPDETVGGTLSVFTDSAGSPDYRSVVLSTTIQFSNTDPTGLVQPGDVIYFRDKPLAAYQPRRIVSVSNPVGSGPYSYQLVLDRPVPPAQFSLQSYSIVRKPRPIVGEPILQLPKDIAIDVDRDFVNPQPTWYRMFPATANNGGTGPFDIMFTPSGQVYVNGFTGLSRICLWVRDVSLNTTGPNVINAANRTDPTVLPPGENMLITVYTRTGHVTSHPVDPAGLVPTTNPNNPTWNPFRFTQDAMSSGQ